MDGVLAKTVDCFLRTTPSLKMRGRNNLRPGRKKCGGKKDSSDQQEEKDNDGRDDIIVESLLKLS